MHVAAFLLTFAVTLVTGISAAIADDDAVLPAALEAIMQAESPAVEPRQVVTLPIRVRNLKQEPDTFDVSLALPAGWSALKPDTAFSLPAAESSVRWASFIVAPTAIAGDYRVGYQVRSQTHPTITAQATIDVHVLPVTRIEARAVNVPDVAAAGETIVVIFSVKNAGNAPVTVEYHAQTALGSPLDSASGSMLMSIGETKRIELRVTPDVAVRPRQELITLTVRAADRPPLQASASIRVLPSEGTGGDLAMTLPINLAVHPGGQADNSQARAGWQTELAGGGVVNSAGRSSLNYLVRQPDQRLGNAGGGTDEYRVEYSDPTSQFALGDRTYALSPLTQGGRYGRGAQVGQEIEGVGVSAYHVEDRNSFTTPGESGLNLGYRVDPTSRVSVNLLDKGDSSRVGGLRHQAAWNRYLDTDVEVADGGGNGAQGGAMRADLKGADDRLKYNLRMLDAGADYTGTYRDTRQHLGSLEYGLSPNLRLHGNARLQRDNLDRDPSRPAPYEQQLSVGPDYRINDRTRFSVDVGGRHRSDEAMTPQFNLDNQSTQLSVAHQIDAVSLKMTGAVGHSQDHLAGSSFATSLASLNAQWQASAGSSYGVYAAYDNNTHTDNLLPAETSIGVNTRLAVSSTASVVFNAQRTSSAIMRNDTLNVSYDHERPNGQKLSVIARYTEGTVPATEMLVSYSVPFQMATTRRIGPGSVRGRIYDLETGKGLGGVLVSLAGFTAVSDGQGIFLFPAVKPGIQYLYFDRSEAAAGKVSPRAVPVEIDVASGAVKVVDLPLVRPGCIWGQVVMYRWRGAPVDESASADQAGAFTGRPIPERGLAGALVVLSQRGSVVRRFTDQEGKFRADGLTPGEWAVTVEREGLPADLELIEPPSKLFVAPGREMELSLELAPKGVGQAIPARASAQR